MKSSAFKNKKEPVRLHKKETKKHNWEIIIVQIGIIIGLILLFLLFILICFLIVPSTHGFFWW